MRSFDSLKHRQGFAGLLTCLGGCRMAQRVTEWFESSHAGSESRWTGSNNLGNTQRLRSHAIVQDAVGGSWDHLVVYEIKECLRIQGAHA